MTNDATLKKLTRSRDETPNVLAPAFLAPRGWHDGDKGLFLADEAPRAATQNLIDELGDHEHLREAKILLLFRMGAKPNADGLVELGKPRKTNGLLRLLAGEGEKVEADFIVLINGDQWFDLPTLARVGLIDHELTHCAATIAGKFVSKAKLGLFVENLGKDHIETCDDVTDDKGRVMVRYRKRKGKLKPGQDGYHDQPLAWRIRKHDVEEFVGVFARWGAWNEIQMRFVDVIEQAEEPTPLLDAAG